MQKPSPDAPAAGSGRQFPVVSSFQYLENLIADLVRQAKADFPLVLRAHIKAWLRYWRSLAWWQGLSMLMAL
jgi:hypothetical protein